MKIDSEPRQFRELFPIDGPIKYVVPDYQRNYSWKEEQIEALFNDMINEDDGYYVGNLLISEEDGFENIIDGQQRLTTLNLMLLALFSRMNKETREQEISRDVQFKLIQDLADIKRRVLVDEENFSPRLELLKKDQEIWSKLVKILDGETNLPNNYGRFAFFKRFVYIADTLLGDLSGQELHDFYEKKFMSLTLLKISVPDLNDAYQVFASLNSKGLPLTPLDLLKNMYLSEIGSTPDKWMELTEVFTDGDNSDKQKMTRFVLNNYDAFEQKSASSLTKGKIVKSYQKLFDKYKSGYIDKLIERAKIYKKIDSDSNEYKYSLSGLAKLNATTTYPFLLNMLVNQEKYELTKENIDDMIKMIINFFIRRNFVLTPKSSNLRSFFNGWRKEIENKEYRGNQVMAFLERKIEKVTPTDDEFIHALNKGIYDQNKQTTRFILIMLQRTFDKKFFNKATPDSLDDFEGKKLRWTIEHILPQGNLPQNWINDIADGNALEASDLQEKHVHRLGNLTLTPYNSGLGQRSFQEKVNYKDGESEVGFNLNIFLNQSIDKGSSKFDIESIEERDQILRNKLMYMIAPEHKYS
ncbi:DNAse/DNA nickase specific for phosphorothioated or glycosylated phage DNA [Fructobacillus fructosus]|uniref:DUF262 domain-containing protein n=1 Tax=Fructobacillus fructosus TaxID=1631 RepID=UPI002DB46DF4|nr:DNAse/DNA nickase specific for phosphorothioated or glycosylated phage DNA [Fructobacillus fructosus]